MSTSTSAGVSPLLVKKAEEKIFTYQSKNLHDYKEILQDQNVDPRAILTYCKFIKPLVPFTFYEMYLIYDFYTGELVGYFHLKSDERLTKLKYCILSSLYIFEDNVYPNMLKAIMEKLLQDAFVAGFKRINVPMLIRDLVMNAMELQKDATGYYINLNNEG